MKTGALTFSVTIELVRTCYECRSTAMRLTAEAIEQNGLATLTLRASGKHNHAVVTAGTNASIADATAHLFATPESDTNGFDAGSDD